MPKIQYKPQRFNASSLLVINQANAIIDDYRRQGFQLTLRQLYYQFVARNWLKNSQKNYKRLGDIISNARLDGRVDWNALVDHTRFVRSLAHFADPGEIIGATIHNFNVDMWENQKYRPEIWIEKDALVSVFERVANVYDVPLFSCRGYTSQSAMWRAAGRLQEYMREGKTPVIFHFGDHDPSGLDMSRDITDRLTMFMGEGPLKRIALNMDQVEEYDPPPNPAKITDSRYEWYIREHDTTDSWELDALDPATLYAAAEEEIKGLIDQKAWDKDKDYQKESREELEKISRNFERVRKLVRKWK